MKYHQTLINLTLTILQNQPKYIELLFYFLINAVCDRYWLIWGVTGLYYLAYQIMSQNAQLSNSQKGQGLKDLQSIAVPLLEDQKQSQQSSKEGDENIKQLCQQETINPAPRHEPQIEQTHTINKPISKSSSRLPSPRLSHAKFRVRSKTQKRDDMLDSNSHRKVSETNSINKALSVDVQHIKSHKKSVSYKEQRNLLQQQLSELTVKKDKLEQLKENKNKLRLKLSRLEVQLRGLKQEQKQSRAIYLISNRPVEDIGKVQSTKNSKLKPLGLYYKKPIKFKQRYQTVANQPDSENRNQQEQQVVNSYYEGFELHHKCLNCKCYTIKKQDVRLPGEVKKEHQL